MELLIHLQGYFFNFMFLISAPSLILSLVLAVFYLANLVFFLVNRQKETDHPIECVNSYPENKQHLQQTTFIQIEDNSLQYKTQNDTLSGTLRIGHFSAVIVAYRNIHRLTLHDIPVIFNPGIGWKLFFRPPPR